MMPPLFLIGARGCGKTTVGHALANALGYAFRDTDHHLQQMTQKSVADVVAEEGWEGFRHRESTALVAVSQPDTVIATGGGMVLALHNRRFMREQGKVIWLAADAEVLAARLTAWPEEGQRPTLTGRPIAEEMRQIVREREALYRQTAHLVVDAMQPPEQVVAQVRERLSLACAS
ncbi:shikimate kinase AroL [Pantoea sp. 1.19]|uniref:shikimate kinase AroL n=1 Tax=Pantoea sp. 1.19 TaxID=1925589 RepID=UPI000948ED2C|nr:shikimate kinase AroL [Pantoea sp. 1.19]